MNKTYRNAVLAAAVSVATVGCGGGADEYEPLPLKDPTTIQGDFAPLAMQDLAYLFGDIFKQLLATLDTTAGTTANLTNEDSTIGKLVTDALSQGQAANDTASGFSVTTGGACSEAGDFNLSAFFTDPEEPSKIPAVDGEYANDFIGEFSNNTIKTSIRANFEACVEQGRKNIDFDPAMDEPGARLDDTINTTINGILDVAFTSFPNAAKSGFQLVAEITMDDFSMESSDDDWKDKGVVRFDGGFNVSLKADDTSNADAIDFKTNIGASFVNTNATSYSKINIEASGELTTNSGFSEFTYVLDFKGSTTNHEVSTDTFEYFATSDLQKTTKDGGFIPDAGQLMVITPAGDAGTATISNNNGTITVTIDYNGQEATCTFEDLLKGSDECAK